MEIILNVNNRSFPMIVNEDDTVGNLKEKILKTKIHRIPHNSHSFELIYRSRYLKDNDKKLSIFKIRKGSYIKIRFTDCAPGSGFIDNLKEESETPIAKNIGFDMNLIKGDELKINLIHFDINMTNGENYGYFNKFKVDVVGGFYAMDDVNILKKFFKKISETHLPFLVVSSGSSGKEIIPICKEYSFIIEIIIFCMDYEHNKHYIDEYPGYVKRVTTSIEELYDYLKQFY